MMLLHVLLAAMLPILAGGNKAKVNPVRRVVNMLERMAAKVEEDAQREEKLYEKYMCYCKSSGANLEKLVAEGEERQPQLETSIEENKALIAQLEQELDVHKKDRSAAEEAIEEAKSMRAQERKLFDKESTEQKANIEAVKKAVQKLEEGIGRTEFLQSDSASFLEGLIVEGSLAKSSNGEALAAFLHEDSEAPQTNEIIGILKQMGEDMQADLDTMVKEEMDARAALQSLKKAKQKEIAAATAAIETKMGRLSDAKVQQVDLEDDLDDTLDALSKNRKLLSELRKSCSARQREYELLSKEQAAEKVAIAETIKILNNDDAQALFKKTLPDGKPAASFLQLRKGASHRIMSAATVPKASSTPAALSFLETQQSSSSEGKSKPGFKKIMKLFDDMLELLKKDQADDDIKKDKCTKEIETNTDSKDALEQDIKAKTADQASLEDQLAVLTEEIAALKDNVMQLDKEVAEATAIRKEENTDFKQQTAENNAAVEVLEMAKNRLEKFYKPTLYQATAAFTELVGTVSGSQGGTAAAQKPQKEASRGVLEMIALIQQDIKKESADIQAAENEAQDEYEEVMRTSEKKRITLTKSLTEKGGVHAETQENLGILKDQKKQLKKELASTVEVLKNLHADCDWFLQNAELRRTARANEAEALQKAQAVMAGADYS
eukprot:CAMPEP_0178419102 /NCGR_PEP_ID=MMETSP0689_2-20121128/25435_1 /TAXON_ID=160604 /ORGANISM="Amphidinium massartii, Strain CS-259" /LENGTH=665 /DNA_ID=CAMNT_0020040525 /DNA_START=69 /DNA_END=2066 /DNA_ORIENTATION=+